MTKIEKPEIKVGDVVVLNSNKELKMTLVTIFEKQINDIDFAFCKWVDKKGKPHVENFPLNSLLPFIDKNQELT